ncbi:MAG: GNAT family N-acetyltransferase [Clostridia bacterium]|nr:GNAT family N-acetyltransferase [Clostridia bacterium]
MKKLIELVTDFAENASRFEEGKRERALYDQFVRASYGMAYAVICADDVKDVKDKADALDRALTRSKEVKLLLDGCNRMKLTGEAFNNRAERKLASVIYRIKKERSALDSKVGKTALRLPRARNIFHARRLTVRTFLKADTEKLLSLYSDPFYKECSLISFDGSEKLYEYLKAEPPFYAVTRKGSGELIGAMGIFADGHGGRRVKLEIGILPEFRACGYFSEIIDGACEYAFSKLNAEVFAVYLPSKRSYLSRPLSRLGFELEGALKSYDKDGEDVFVYSKMR